MDLRRAILDSSLKLIEEKGLDALSMREVARSLQVTHGAPYYHFPDRSAILAALVEEGLVVLTQELENAAKAQEDPRAAFEACGRSYVEFALTHGAYFRVMFRPELTGKTNRAAIDAAAAKSFAVLVDVIRRCQAAGICTEIDTEALALTGWSTAHGLASLCLDGPLSAKGDPRELAKTVGKTLGALLAHGPTLAAR
ncbi:MAG TPA: TetR/AcrR family transcriptional regulator [Polyangium sp.]|nr:TetR/AcrR family transcriptional regulator [Polyangium sp.]